ncbi:MAG: hypothetical protein AAGJ81_15170 [Verrucomicrobiota bacterium]
MKFEAKDSEKVLAHDLGAFFEFALGMQEGVLLVDRNQMGEAFDELGLGVSGAVSPESLVAIGKLTGAKILMAGRLLKIGEERVVICKIMDTGTMRLVSVKASFANEDEIFGAVDSLAEQVAEKILENSDELSSTDPDETYRIEPLYEMAREMSLPTVQVLVAEEHVGWRVPDPAAQTELIRILREIGFTVLDPLSTEDPYVLITGEAFNEADSRFRSLISCWARVEVKAVHLSSGDIIFSDADDATAVDTAEFIAGKSSLQKAGGKVSPALAKALIKDAGK